MKFLISETDDWGPGIQHSFRGSGHDLTFARFSDSDLEGYDVYLPLVIPDLKYVNTAMHVIKNNPLPIPGLDCICTCDDKMLFNRKLDQSGFNEYVPMIVEPQSYPYILKKRIDWWGRNSYVITNRESEAELQHLIRDEEYFCQDLIKGTKEYTAHILYADGQVLNCRTMEIQFKTDHGIKGKDSWLYRSQSDECQFPEIFKSVMDLVGFQGLCCFNYKIVAGRPLIFELNPRCGGTICSNLYTFLKPILGCAF